MSDFEPKKKPVGTLKLVISRDGEPLESIDGGAVWRSERGTLTFELSVWPYAWTGAAKRRMMIVFYEKQ